MNQAELDDFARWIEQKIRTQEAGLTDGVKDQWIYVSGVGVKLGLREALEELQRRRARSGAMPEDQDPAERNA